MKQTTKNEKSTKKQTIKLSTKVKAGAYVGLSIGGGRGKGGM